MNKKKPRRLSKATAAYVHFTFYGTVTVQDVLMPLAVVAVITAVQDANALIFPLASTVTTAGLLLPQREKDNLLLRVPI